MIVIILTVLVVFLIFYIKRLKRKTKSKKEFEYFRCKHIIKNKEHFTKLTIQKAQQGIDKYLNENKTK